MIPPGNGSDLSSDSDDSYDSEDSQVDPKLATIATEYGVGDIGAQGNHAILRLAEMSLIAAVRDIAATTRQLAAFRAAGGVADSQGGRVVS